MSKLAISIPTYNRPEILEENLKIMIPYLKEKGIPVYISDDSNNDLTKNVIEKLRETYPNIYYFKNEHSLGHDKNCLRTLNLANEEYIWYLGDSQIITLRGIEIILDTIDKNIFDFLLVSSTSRNIKIKSSVYHNCNLFFVDLAWHATMTGSTIYRKDILFKSNYNNYLNTNFIQLGILLQEMILSENGLCWLNENVIYGNRNKGNSYWMNRVFQVFANDWYDFIYSLPKEYTKENKKKVVKSHSKNTGIFGFRNLVQLRIKNILNIKTYLIHLRKLRHATSISILFVLFIALTPRVFLKIVHGFYSGEIF